MALASDPTLLLLDEPLTGMNAEETASMIKIVKDVNSSRGTTIIVVEHNVRAVLGLCAAASYSTMGRSSSRGPRESAWPIPPSSRPIWGPIPMWLEIKDLAVRYEGAEVVKGVSMYLEPGEIVTLIGRNGAGKSTILRAISGLKAPRPRRDLVRRRPGSTARSLRAS